MRDLQEVKVQRCKFRVVRTSGSQVSYPSTEPGKLGAHRKEISAVSSPSSAVFACGLARHQGLVGGQTVED